MHLLLSRLDAGEVAACIVVVYVADVGVAHLSSPFYSYSQVRMLSVL